MNNKKVTIKTNSIKHPFLKTLLVIFLIYIAIFLWIFFPNVSIIDLPQSLDTKKIIEIAIISGVIALPFQVIHIVTSIIKHINNKEDSTYVPIQGIEFYRDKLTGLTPGMISFLVNLKFEQQKDINSMIMYYEHLGVIETNNDAIIVKDYNHPKLTASDKKLLTFLSNPEKEAAQYINWTNAETQKCIEKGYITKKGVQYYLKRIIKLILVGIIVAWLIKIAASIVIKIITENVFLSTEVPPETKNTILIIFIVVCFILAIIEMALAFGGPIFLITDFKTKSPYLRTKLGNQITEQIHGLKRFIKEFSNLESSTKKELILWEEFLIYAVVLEENTKIIDEITYYKNSNY